MKKIIVFILLFTLLMVNIDTVNSAPNSPDFLTIYSLDNGELIDSLEDVNYRFIEYDISIVVTYLAVEESVDTDSFFSGTWLTDIVVITIIFIILFIMISIPTIIVIRVFDKRRKNRQTKDEFGNYNDF